MTRKKVVLGVMSVIVLAAVAVLFLRHSPTLPARNGAAPSHPAARKLGPDDSPFHIVPQPKAPETTVKEAHAREQKEPEKPASVSGHVRDTYSNGIQGAKIELAVFDEDRSSKTVLGSYTAVTDADGAYRVDGIVHFGRVHLRASAEGYVTLDTSLRGGGPGMPNLRQVKSGSAYTAMDFSLKTAKSFIRGKVVNQNREPLPDAVVRVAIQYGLENKNQGVYSATTGGEGRFDLGLPSASECVLIVQKQGYAEGNFPGVLPGSDNLELVLSSGGTIAGQITSKTGFASFRKGAPLKGVEVAVLPEARKGVVGNEWETVGPASVFTDQDGNYRVDNLPEKFTYTVRVVLPQLEDTVQPVRVRTLEDSQTSMQHRCNGLYTLNFASFITSIAEKTGVRVYAGTVTTCNLAAVSEKLRPAVVYGQVKDASTGEPVFGLLVYAFSDELAQSAKLWGPMISMASTDAEGRYRLVLPALDKQTRFTITAEYWTVQGAFDSNVEKNTVSEIALGPGDEEQVDFTAPGTVTLPVRFVSAQRGMPLAGVNLALDGQDTRLVSDSEGRVVARGVRPNIPCTPGAMRARADGTGTVLLGTGPSVSGHPGETLPEVEIQCQCPGSFTGHIVVPQNITIPPEARIECQMEYMGNNEPLVRDVYLMPDGRFEVLDVFAGLCNLHFYIPSEKPEERYWGDVMSVEIGEDMVTDLGDLQPQPPILSRAQ